MGNNVYVVTHTWSTVGDLTDDIDTETIAVFSTEKEAKEFCYKYNCNCVNKKYYHDHYIEYEKFELNKYNPEKINWIEKEENYT